MTSKYMWRCLDCEGFCDNPHCCDCGSVQLQSVNACLDRSDDLERRLKAMAEGELVSHE